MGNKFIISHGTNMNMVANGGRCFRLCLGHVRKKTLLTLTVPTVKHRQGVLLPTFAVALGLLSPYCFCACKKQHINDVRKHELTGGFKLTVFYIDIFLYWTETEKRLKTFHFENLCSCSHWTVCLGHVRGKKKPLEDIVYTHIKTIGLFLSHFCPFLPNGDRRPTVFL